MSFKPFGGLAVDFDAQQGSFTMPEEITFQDHLFQMDILSNWMQGIDTALLNASVNYFMQLCSETHYDKSTFELHYLSFLNMLTAMQIRHASGLEECCLKAYSAKYP